jgi:cytochrome c oxidase subunit IV
MMLQRVVGAVVSHISKDDSSCLFMVRQSGAAHPLTKYHTSEDMLQVQHVHLPSYMASLFIFSMISYVVCYKGHQCYLQTFD